MDYRELDLCDRRLMVAASPERALELQNRVTWSDVLTVSLLSATVPGYVYYKAFQGLVRLVKGPKKPLYPVFDLKTVRDQFKFPANHPVDGLTYVCCEVEPDFYVPLASFHHYMYEAKAAAFQELCANLGVRYCRVVYAEEDGQDVTVRFRASASAPEAVSASVGASGAIARTSGASASIFAAYGRPDEPLTETQSGWMSGEPTWRLMQKMRLKGGKLESFRADFSYSDSMGVDADVAGKITRAGLNIGGQFMQMRRRKWSFDVEFWPLTAARRRKHLLKKPAPRLGRSHQAPRS